MQNKYMQSKGVRRENRTMAGRFRGGKLAPVMAVPFRESESGSVEQTIVYELDPIAGRMITDITADIVSVFVPTPAMLALKFPNAPLSDSSEYYRQTLLTGDPVFVLAPETEISKRLGIVPRSINGNKLVNEVSYIGHNVAVNFLRRRKYVKAAQLAYNNLDITPAILSKTVLDRLNGVLDPEDRVNGAVNLTGNLPVRGFGAIKPRTPGSGHTNVDVVEAGGENKQYPRAGYTPEWGTDGAGFAVEVDYAGVPSLYADLGGATEVSLSDFYKAELMDSLVREMRELVDMYPEHGEELVSRFAHGLSVQLDNQPFVVYENSVTFSNSMQRAMDGANLDKTQSNLAATHTFTAPIPKSEFGGVLYTFAVVRPDETLASQPHPILSDHWSVYNYVADEMAIDPVPVTIRDLHADCAQADEKTIALYVGNNHLKKTYINYGFNRHLDPNTVAAKTALWQLQVPMSVTPQSVIYPENLSHYPFADQNAEVCTYTVNSKAIINTPIIFGPEPVEELAEIENADIFEES